MKLSNYIKIFPYHEEPGYLLLYSTKKASSALVPESTLKAVEDGNLEPSDADTLFDLGFLVDDPDEEKNEMLRSIDTANRERKAFSALVVMNLDCNLRCTYCYEGMMKGKHYMSRDTADALISFTEDRYLSNGKKVHFDFYGGEPLLSYELIKYISEKLRALAGELGLAYTFNLVTNGTLLTAKRAKELASLGLMDAKITVDGLKGNHDRFRPFKSGSGSFDIIIRNIRNACGNIGIQIGGNYTQENYKDFPRLLDYLIDHGITPDKISYVKFDPVTQPRKEVALPDFRDGTESINEPWVFEASLFLREEILKRGFQTLRIMPSTCMIENKDDIVVNYNGTFYKCPALIGWQGLEAGDLQRGITDYRESHRLDIWKRQECLECAYLPICYGGCRFMKLLRDGQIDGVDCKKPYLDATLEAFILQDIKYTPEIDNS
ncbi:MAG: geopeptide radical SAM maturase [Nitrospirae bacterium]|nr:geopeptide radical SAM maturase [Nitrospirota bacterium]